MPDKWITLPNGNSFRVSEYLKSLDTTRHYIPYDLLIDEQKHLANIPDYLSKHDNKPFPEERVLPNFLTRGRDKYQENSELTKHQNKMIEKVGKVQNETWNPKSKGRDDTWDKKERLLYWKSNRRFLG